MIHFVFDVMPVWFLLVVGVAIFSLGEWIWGKFRDRQYGRRT